MPSPSSPPATQPSLAPGNLKWTVFLALSATLLMLLFFGPTDNDSWDPSFYYAQIRSPIIDHDLNLRGETNTRGFILAYTVTGLQGSAYPLGPGLLWSPFFLAAHLATLILMPAQADGYSYLYISLVTLGSALFGVVALYLIYRACRFFAERGLAFLAVCLCFFASPLFFFMFRQPVMSHTTNLFASAGILLVYLFLDKNHDQERWSGLLFGVFLGLCFLTRWSGLILAILPLFFFGSRLYNAIHLKKSQEVKSVLLQVLVMAATFLVMISPQLVFWYRLHRSLLVFPTSRSDFLANLLPPNFFQIFTHTNRGLPYWFPFSLLGMLGFFFIPDRKLKVAAFIYIFLLTFLLGYRKDWYGGGVFGARYYLEALPFFAIGFVAMTRRLSRAPAGKAVLIVLAILLIAHQFMLMQAVEHAAEPGWVSLVKYLRGKPLGLRWQLEASLRLLQEPETLFSPRPYVGLDRQTVLVNLLHGERHLQNYLIPSVAVLLTPFVIIAIIAMARRARPAHLLPLSLGLLGLMLTWAVYLSLLT